VYHIFACHFSKETIHPEVSVRGCQRTDYETRLIALSLVIHRKTAHPITGKERCHLFLCRLVVDID
jgi:hypothetical protein